MCIYEAKFFSFSEGKEIVRTFEVDDDSFENYEECWKHAVSVAFNSIEDIESFISLMLVSC